MPCSRTSRRNSRGPAVLSGVRRPAMPGDRRGCVLPGLGEPRGFAADPGLPGGAQGLHGRVRHRLPGRSVPGATDRQLRARDGRRRHLPLTAHRSEQRRLSHWGGGVYRANSGTRGPELADDLGEVLDGTGRHAGVRVRPRKVARCDLVARDTKSVHRSRSRPGRERTRGPSRRRDSSRVSNRSSFPCPEFSPGLPSDRDRAPAFAARFESRESAAWDRARRAAAGAAGCCPCCWPPNMPGGNKPGGSSC